MSDIIDFFVFLKHNRKNMYEKLKLELNRYPTVTESFNRYSFAYSHIKNIRKKVNHCRLDNEIILFSTNRLNLL